MASGISPNDKCLNDYQDLKLRHKYKYIIYNLGDDKTEIVVEKTSTALHYDDFLSDLPEAECRWAVYDFEYEQEGGKRNKIVFLSWAPDIAKIKNKMMFASSKDALRRALVGIGADIQATDISEAAYEIVHDKVTRAR